MVFKIKYKKKRERKYWNCGTILNGHCVWVKKLKNYVKERLAPFDPIKYLTTNIKIKKCILF